MKKKGLVTDEMVLKRGSNQNEASNLFAVSFTF